MKNEKKYVSHFMAKMLLVERIKRCYKTDAELAAEEQEKFVTKIKSEVDLKLKSLKGELLEKKSFDEFETRFKAIEEKSKLIMEEKQKDQMIKELNDLALKVKAWEEKPKKASTKKMTLKSAIMDAMKEKETEVKEVLAGRQTKPLILNLKSAITITDAATIEAVGSASHWSLTSFTGIISKIRKRILRYLEGVAVGGLSIDRPYAMWIEELDEQGTPIFIAEGATKTQVSVRYEEREKKAKKIAVYSKISTEFLRFLPQLVSFIQNNMLKRLDIVTEDQLFNGDDTGDNLKGILSYATAFDGGVGTAGGAGLVGKVFNPSNFDVLRAVALQVENSYGIPYRVFITPDKMAEMDVAKDTEGRYLMPPFISADGKIVAGMELIPTNALSGLAYDFVGGDLSVVNVSFLEQANIQIGLDGNDFTKNLKTILVEQMLVQFVSANDTKVIVKGDFASAKTLIATA